MQTQRGKLCWMYDDTAPPTIALPTWCCPCRHGIHIPAAMCDWSCCKTLGNEQCSLSNQSGCQRMLTGHNALFSALRGQFHAVKSINGFDFDDEMENLSVVFVCHVLVLLHKIAKFIRKTYGLMSADLPRNFNMEGSDLSRLHCQEKIFRWAKILLDRCSFVRSKYCTLLRTGLCLHSIEQNSGCTTARGPRGDTADEEESAKVVEP